jgi:peptide/nickel transport system substrate-binding protein
MNRSRRNHRSITAVVALFMLFGGLLSAGAVSAQDATPQAGGTLVVASDVEPTCFDPQISAADATNKLARNVLDQLVAQKSDGTFAPWLATSYTISDGTPFNAEAVKYNVDRVVDPNTKSQYAVSLMGPYDSTTVVDDYTVTVNFKEAFSPFLQAISQPFLGIESPAALAKNQPCDPPVGTGAFMFSKVEPQQSVTLVKNPNYNSASPLAGHSGPAYLDTLQFQWIPDNSVRAGAVQSGQVDAADLIEPKDVDGLVGDGLNLLTADAPGAPYQLFINSSNAPWNDVRVRQAFMYSLDLDGIVNAVYFGKYKRAWGPIGPTTFGYDPTIEGSWQQDIDKANALLDAAGWVKNGDYREKDGQKLVARWPYAQGSREQRDQVGQFIKEQAAVVGIDVEIEAVGVGPYLEAAQSNNYDIGDFGFIRSDPDVLRSLFDSTNRVTKEQIRQNWTQTNDPQVDEWVREAAQTVDPAARAALYAKVQHWSVDNAITIPIYVTSELFASQPKVHGVTSDPQSYPTFYDAWVEQ